jgi:hypothetical protein
MTLTGRGPNPDRMMPAGRRWTFALGLTVALVTLAAHATANDAVL